MRRLLFFGLLCGILWGFSIGKLGAQTAPLLGDEWIQLQQSYYKIPVSRNGVYRITGGQLVAHGLPAALPGSQFRLFRLGKQVPLIVSSNGAFSNTDFIEFYGAANDGAADAALYPSPEMQADPGQSLFSDTAWYFLTWTAAGSGLRMTNATTPVPATPASVAADVRATVYKSYRKGFRPGNSHNRAYLLFSSQFGEGEGLVEGNFSPGHVFTENLPTPEGQSGSVELTAGVSGFSLDDLNTGVTAPAHPIKIFVGGGLTIDTTYGAQQYRRFRGWVPGWNQAATTTVSLQSGGIPGAAGNYNYWGVHFVALKYPRSLNFSGKSYAEFELEASTTSQLLALQNIAAVRLYDLEAQRYYDADVSVAGQARFYMEPSAKPRKCVVLTAAAYSGVTDLPKVHFRDYTATGGDYVLISHPALNGADRAVEAFEAYRASPAGGGYRTLLAYMPDLYDQFAGGISQHPLAIKNFLARLRRSAAIKPVHVALVGHGVTYPVYRSGSPTVFPYALVPTYGYPGSDAFFTDDGSNALSVGRIPVLNSTELMTYLEKVKAYEEALTRVPPVPSPETERWKKKVLHIAGASDPVLQKTLLATLHNAAPLLTDTPFAADLLTIAKNTTNPIDPITNSFMDSVMNAGMGLITFHGHAYAGGFDYNINEPERYTNRPRLPLLLALGCNISQVFDTGNRTISERYLFATRGGAIAMLAGNQLQFPEFHSNYLKKLYTRFSGKENFRTMGEQVAAGYNQILRDYPGDGFQISHLESMLFQGDPALRLYAPEKPDFYIGKESIFAIPAQVTTALDSFRIKMVTQNLARGFRDTGLVVRIQREHPSGQKTLAHEYRLPELLRADTMVVWIPIDKRNDLGINRFTVTIDPEGKIPELSEANNSATYELFISGNNLAPVFPYPFSIVSEPPTLKASTLNPFAPEAGYLMEIDTTELFNSPLLRRHSLSSRGGVVKWKPDLPYTDSTVYYWRTAYAPKAGDSTVWMGASFTYLPQAGEGWSQSHLYQYLYNARNGLQYDAAGRTFDFDRIQKRIGVRCKVMYNDDDVENNKVQADEVDIQRSSCLLRNTTIQILVIDPGTGEIWENTPARVDSFGSAPRCKLNRSERAFEFPVNDSSGRNKARKFLQRIPAGKFVLVKSSVYAVLYNPTDAAIWAGDSSVYGSGNTLYDYLKGQGFSKIDSFSGKRAFVFWYGKEMPGYAPFEEVGTTDTSIVVKEFVLQPHWTAGAMTSVTVGPSESWKSLHWASTVQPAGADAADQDTVFVYGLDSHGANDTLLFKTTARDTSLEALSALQFPRLRLSWHTEDTLRRKARQLRHWRVHHTPLPELALHPAAFFSLSDSEVVAGQPITMKVALENISNRPLDSVRVRYRVVREDGTLLPLADMRYRPLLPDDTLHAVVHFGTVPYVGDNFLFIEANPEEDQPEQYHPNNLGYLPFRVAGDKLNPLLEVTFDSVYISDRDIVSPQPEIRIRLTSANRYRLLQDTSLIRIYLKSPDDPISLLEGRRIPYDSLVCRFIPARLDSTGKLRNEAHVIFKPKLTHFSTSPNENLYELIVKAQDAAGTPAGSNDYRVSFRAVATSGISQVYCYPNPFRTGTRFAFLITGDALPQALTIQIADLSGRIVRTLSLAELGRLRIGQNLPAYEWDGRDDAGTPLPAGVYLYRATVESGRQPLQHIRTGVDGSFKNGWGRMLFLPQ